METIILLMVIAAAAVFMLAPLVQKDSPEQRLDATGRAVADAVSRRDATYEALSDLDEDRAAGKLSDEDYERLKRSYQEDAVKALQDLDRLEKTEGDPGSS